MRTTTQLQLQAVQFTILILLSQATVTTAAPADEHGKMRNITVTLPEGTHLFNDSEIICMPANWKDVAIFFLVNYVTHALTTVVLPGEGWESYMTNALASLMFPGFGAYRGLRAIFVGWATVRKRFRSEPWEQGDTKYVHKNKARRVRDLQKARRAGALCMIVRSHGWEPRDGDLISKNAMLVQGSARESFLNGTSKKEAIVTEQELDDQALLQDAPLEMRSMSGGASLLGIQLHTYSTPWTYCRKRCPDSVGSRTIRCAPAELSPGYHIIMVPSCTPVRNLIDDAAVDRINSNYDIMRGLVALVQALLAIQTLYQTRGDQLDRYGYAAFGLTVAPYAVMSLVNLLGSLARPDYDAVYMVGSPIMVEERRRKGLDGYYDGVVGEVFEADTDSNESFADNKVEEGSQFVKSPMQFVTVENELHVRFANWGIATSPYYNASEDTLVKVITGRLPPDSAAPSRSLFVPNASPFSYNRAKKGLIDEPLPSPLVLSITKWPGKLLPRSTRYIKRSRYFAFVLSLSPVVIIFVLSKFRSGSSTILQQAITMLWLAWGSVIGFLVAKYERSDTIGEKVNGVTRVRSVLVKAVFFLVLGWPAVAGWWVVAEMLLDYGKCVKLPS